jgi:YtkA-like
LKSFIILILSGILLAGCNSNSPVDPSNNNTNSSYTKINTFENGTTKFELWSASGTSLYYGYNDIGFKVFLSGVEQQSGFAKFYPKMYHSLGSPMHSAPVDSSFIYDSGKQLFAGYVCFTMISDSLSFWFGDCNYNNTAHVDSIRYNVTSNLTNQMRYWDDIVGGHTYLLTIIEPQNAKVGLNNLSFVLHQTNNDKNFYEVNGADMYIRPWMPSHGHGSSSNVNPASLGGGKYTGKVNFSMSGGWEVYDSIAYNGGVITGNNSQKFTFDVY